MFVVKTNQTSVIACFPTDLFLPRFHLTEPLIPEPIPSLTLTCSQRISSGLKELLGHRRVLDSQATVRWTRERGQHDPTLPLVESQQMKGGSWTGKQVCFRKLLLVTFLPYVLAGQELRRYSLSPLLIFFSRE